MLVRHDAVVIPYACYGWVYTVNLDKASIIDSIVRRIPCFQKLNLLILRDNALFAEYIAYVRGQLVTGALITTIMEWRT